MQGRGYESSGESGISGKELLRGDRDVENFKGGGNHGDREKGLLAP